MASGVRNRIIGRKNAQKSQKQNERPGKPQWPTRESVSRGVGRPRTSRTDSILSILPIVQSCLLCLLFRLLPIPAWMGCRIHIYEWQGWRPPRGRWQFVLVVRHQRSLHCLATGWLLDAEIFQPKFPALRGWRHDERKNDVKDDSTDACRKHGSDYPQYPHMPRMPAEELRYSGADSRDVAVSRSCHSPSVAHSARLPAPGKRFGDVSVATGAGAAALASTGATIAAGCGADTLAGPLSTRMACGSFG